MRISGQHEAQLADAQREAGALWAHCELLELSRAVCEMARHVAPGTMLRTLDAIHSATFVLARERIDGLEFLTADRRSQEAAAIT